ncbi:MAG: hypothetical protein ACYS15_12140 [Planctomycetota bacterium]|jgi:hypothetical protein
MTSARAEHAPGLANLDQVELTGPYRMLYDQAAETAGGQGGWLSRKKFEARKLLALAQIAESRMDVQMLDLLDDLCAMIRLTVPVPLTPDADGALRVANGAVLGLAYPQVALSSPIPGYAPVTLLSPSHGAWHPNIGTARGQRLCLGASLPAGIPASEIVLLSYGLLTMQSVMLDPDDSAGVMNAEAASFWQARLDDIPLSDEPFLRPAGK